MRSILLSLIVLALFCALMPPAEAAPRTALVLDGVKQDDTERATPAPVMAVYSDGRVIVRDPWNRKDEPVVGSISRTRLVKLLNVIVQRLGFMAVKKDDIDAGILKVQQERYTPDAPEEPTATRIAVTWGDTTNEVVFPGLNWYATRYPEVDELQRMHTVSRLLHTLRLETMAGGKEVVDESVELINKQLRLEDDGKRYGKKSFSTKRVKVSTADLKSVVREPERILLKFTHKHTGRHELRIGATAQVDRETGEIMVLITAGKEPGL